jgi:hypothetical protein
VAFACKVLQALQHIGNQRCVLQRQVFSSRCVVCQFRRSALTFWSVWPATPGWLSKHTRLRVFALWSEVVRLARSVALVRRVQMLVPEFAAQLTQLVRDLTAIDQVWRLQPFLHVSRLVHSLQVSSQSLLGNNMFAQEDNLGTSGFLAHQGRYWLDVCCRSAGSCWHACLRQSRAICTARKRPLPFIRICKSGRRSWQIRGAAVVVDDWTVCVAAWTDSTTSTTDLVRSATSLQRLAPLTIFGVSGKSNAGWQDTATEMGQEWTFADYVWHLLRDVHAANFAG